MSRDRSSTTILKQKVVNFVQDDENSKKDDKYSYKRTEKSSHHSLNESSNRNNHKYESDER